MQNAHYPALPGTGLKGFEPARWRSTAMCDDLVAVSFDLPSGAVERLLLDRASAEALRDTLSDYLARTKAPPAQSAAASPRSPPRDAAAMRAALLDLDARYS